MGRGDILDLTSQSSLPPLPLPLRSTVQFPYPLLIGLHNEPSTTPHLNIYSVCTLRIGLILIAIPIRVATKRTAPQSSPNSNCSCVVSASRLTPKIKPCSTRSAHIHCLQARPSSSSFLRQKNTPHCAISKPPRGQALRGREQYRKGSTVDIGQNTTSKTDKMSGEAWLFLFAVLINAVNLFLQVFFTIMYSDLEWYVKRNAEQRRKLENSCLAAAWLS